MIKGNYSKKFDKFPWKKNPTFLQAWKKGLTGYPIVDAGMRELNNTGWMHNRVRMITAGFLCKHLLTDWRYGEKYFAKKLLDFELSSNNGNWQWVASTGADSQPYFRIFNPWTQSEKFDKDCSYIKKWIPELKELQPKVIHNWFKYYKEYKDTIDYPEPIVDHSEMREKTLDAYKNI